jgi:YD repeat-containing protein
MGFDRTCQLNTTTDTEHWDSKSDFIDEAAAVGLRKVLTSTRSAPLWVTAYEYDAQQRILKITSGGSLYATYDAWDDLGRPLHLVLAGACGGVESTMSYDDHSVTSDVSSGPCRQHSVTTYDGDGIPTKVDYGDGTTATYTTTARATVCR